MREARTVEKVVYLLGAGFSAPANLPVMKDFLSRSKELLNQEPQRFAHFKAVLETIKEMHYTKSYYHADLHNVEEVLSILVMQDAVSNDNRSAKFERYIEDVVTACTPEIPEVRAPELGPKGEPKRGYLWKLLRPPDSVMPGYYHFVANLLSLRFDWYPGEYGTSVRECFPYSRADKCQADYSVVTLNYDLLIENSIAYVRDNFMADDNRPRIDFSSLPTAKLHGSVDTAIVPPTWRKMTLGTTGIAENWKLAYDLLREANQIRVLGYSLPPSDHYLRYLLQAALVGSDGVSHDLKHIDVISLDPDGSLRPRYQDFVDPSRLRFKNARLEDHIGWDGEAWNRMATLQHVGADGSSSDRLALEFTTLEDRHCDFMSRDE